MLANKDSLIGHGFALIFSSIYWTRSGGYLVCVNKPDDFVCLAFSSAARDFPVKMEQLTDHENIHIVWSDRYSSVAFSL